MRRLLLGVHLLLLLGMVSAKARIGETLDQCKQRYGNAMKIPTPYEFGPEASELVYYKFFKNGIVVQVGILNGKAADLSFSHAPVSPPPPADGNAPEPPTAPTPPLPLTPEEIETLLDANSSSMKWKSVSDGKITFFSDTTTPPARYGPYWRREDGVIATSDTPYLHIFTPAWMTYIDKAMKAHHRQAIETQKKNLEGF
jgi:hypothetical protein